MFATESLPYFDDVILSHRQVITIYEKFEERLEEALKIPGFKSEEVNKLGRILKIAIDANEGISTFAD